jgi:hypothetical protein
MKSRTTDWHYVAARDGNAGEARQRAVVAPDLVFEICRFFGVWNLAFGIF